MKHALAALRKTLALLLLLLIASLPLSAAERMQLWITVDWEGLSLDEENLHAIQHFRQAFPHIPLVHLINPAYFLVPGVNRAQAAFLIRSTFLAQDTVGLHVHPMRTLVQHCGLHYQSGPTVADRDEHCQEASCGYSVSLEYAYTQTELTQLISCASTLMVSNGFNRPRHFRAGAWQFGPKLQAALEANQFVWDSSRIDANLLTPRWRADSPMIRMLTQLHPQSTPMEQPHALTYTLMEYPNNAALADYTSTKQLVQLFDQLASAHKPVMVMGFHQETAADFLIQLTQAIPRIEKLAAQRQIEIEWMH